MKNAQASSFWNIIVFSENSCNIFLIWNSKEGMKQLFKKRAGFLLILGIVVAWPVQVHAQQYGFGIKTQAAVMTQTGNFKFNEGAVSLDLSSGFISGYSVGFFSRLTLDDSWKLVTELNFSRYGASYDGSFEFQNQVIFTESTTGIRYFQIPVLLEWHTLAPDLGPYRYQRPYWSWHAKGGIYGGYRIDAVFSGNNSAEILGVNFASEFSNDVTDSFKAFDAGITLGGAVEYGLRRKYGFETRFVMGLYDVGNNNTTRNIGLLFGFYYLL